MDDQTPLPFPVAARDLLRCIVRSAVLLGRGRVHLRRADVGRRLQFAGGSTTWIYRDTVVDRPPVAEPCVLIVQFRLRGIRRPWAHALFRLESWLNTPLFVGFPGFVSKWWLAADEHGVYRGVYDYDGPERADAYARALWWVLALVSVRDSIHHRVLPGLRRDEIVRGPSAPGEPAAFRALLPVR